MCAAKELDADAYADEIETRMKNHEAYGDVRWVQFFVKYFSSIITWQRMVFLLVKNEEPSWTFAIDIG